MGKKSHFIFRRTQVKPRGEVKFPTQLETTSIDSVQNVCGDVLDNRKPVRQLNADVVVMETWIKGVFCLELTWPS